LRTDISPRYTFYVLFVPFFYITFPALRLTYARISTERSRSVFVAHFRPAGCVAPHRFAPDFVAPFAVSTRFVCCLVRLRLYTTFCSPQFVWTRCFYVWLFRHHRCRLHTFHLFFFFDLPLPFVSFRSLVAFYVSNADSYMIYTFVRFVTRSFRLPFTVARCSFIVPVVPFAAPSLRLLFALIRTTVATYRAFLHRLFTTLTLFYCISFTLLRLARSRSFPTFC